MKVSVPNGARRISCRLFPLQIIKVVLWAFLAWKIHTHPRAWGKGVGVFLVVVALKDAVQIAVTGERCPLGLLYVPQWPLIIVWQSLVFLTGICSVFLWFGYPENPVPEKPQEQTEPRSD